tara:strand:- start:458 stop:1330 length:873 start_codon:yes stop_codon:yes gene_type:complete
MTIKNKCKVLKSIRKPERHWVGNGFFVHGLLRPNNELNKFISPFIMLDYASPMEFKKTEEDLRGVGEHPHRGFETVTFAYQGEIQHKDSSGGGGLIKPGDVQWMTAGKGLVHTEFHSKEYSKKGGLFEMVQLWINLPKSRKMTKPKYQAIIKQNIPIIEQDQVSLRVISGEYKDVNGPAKTFTNLNIFDIKAKKKGRLIFTSKENYNSILLIMSGKVIINDKQYDDKTLIIFENNGNDIHIDHCASLKGLFLSGEPINEPIYSYGPFVMNTKEEVELAIRDYQTGKMGSL